jgi:hypothetical protein
MPTGIQVPSWFVAMRMVALAGAAALIWLG